MNWVLIVVLGILAVSAATGYYKGLLRIAYSLVAWGIVLVAVAWATPHVTSYIMENTKLYEGVETQCAAFVRRSADERMEKMQEKKAEELEAHAENGLADLGIRLPESLLDTILEGSVGGTDAFLEEYGIYEKAAASLADFVIQGIAFLIALVFAGVLVHVLSQMIGIASHIPIIKGVNRFLGFFLGGIYGVFVVWLGFYVVALLGAGEKMQTVISYIYANPFLTWLYENNLVLTFIMKYF